ncbi:hypothetical protein [uncultured Treponema sp.]|uniref:hypothetical protein n=1 Tax=uncultured Treponema sp. TaxID=162155 RepID=UPI0025D1802C|nr:hypothetical protein [uncultured Treponema sp.]
MQKKFLYTILIIFSIFLWILCPAFRHELKISNKCALEFENDSGAVILSFFDNSTVEAFVHEEKKFEISFAIFFAFFTLLVLVVEKNVDFSLYALNVPVRHKYIDFVIKQTSVL